MLQIRREAGFDDALLGMALSYYDGLEPIETWWNEERKSKALRRAGTLAFKQGGHNKFLESMQVWMLIKASRGFWQEFDTYRAGVTKQSASTMHTISKRLLTTDDFTGDTAFEVICFINKMIKVDSGVNEIKANLPEGFLQLRMVCTNYKTLQNIVFQRRKHRLKEWRTFCSELQCQLMYPGFIFPDGVNDG